MSNHTTLLNHHSLFETDFVRIYHNFADDWIYIRWIGQQSSEKVQIGYEQLLLAINSENCSKLLVDDTDVTDIFSESTEWIMNNFVPRSIEAGLKYVAVVYSPNQFTRLSTDARIAMLPPPIMCIAFNDIQEATDWLRST